MVRDIIIIFPTPLPRLSELWVHQHSKQWKTVNKHVRQSWALWKGSVLSYWAQEHITVTQPGLELRLNLQERDFKSHLTNEKSPQGQLTKESRWNKKWYPLIVALKRKTSSGLLTYKELHNWNQGTGDTPTLKRNKDRILQKVTCYSCKECWRKR